jgi:hypothetical protein
VIQSADEFVRLRRSEDPTDCQRAANDEAPVDVWLAIVQRFPDLREWVAHNKTVPLSVLEQLATDHNPSVRATVASKRKLSLELQMLLANDQDSSVRERLACNVKCEAKVLRGLATDPEAFVREAATKRLEARCNAL